MQGNFVRIRRLAMSRVLVFPLWFEILSAESQDAHSARFDWKSSRCSRFSFARNISRRSQDEGSSSKLSCIVKGRIDKTFLFCYPAASTQPKHKEVFHVEIGRRCSFDSLSGAHCYARSSQSAIRTAFIRSS